MTELGVQVREGFLKYGTAEWVKNHYVKQSIEWEVKYKTEGYVGDIVPASWDDYILTNDHANGEEANNGIIEDMVDEDADDAGEFK